MNESNAHDRDKIKLQQEGTFQFSLGDLEKVSQRKLSYALSWVLQKIKKAFLHLEKERGCGMHCWGSAHISQH